VSLPRSCPAGHELSPGQVARRCAACRRDLVTTRVAEADPSLVPEQISAAVGATLVNPAVLRDLAAALADGPGALRAGAPASVGRLVAELRERGSQLPEPRCAACGRTDRPLYRSGEGASARAGAVKSWPRHVPAAASGAPSYLVALTARPVAGAARSVLAAVVASVGRKGPLPSGQKMASPISATGASSRRSPPAPVAAGASPATSSSPGALSVPPAALGARSPAPTAGLSAHHVPAGPRGRCASRATGRPSAGAGAVPAVVRSAGWSFRPG
jgi:hypothetical protein